MHTHTYMCVYIYIYQYLIIVVVQSLSHVWLFVTPWTAACQAFLSFTISWSLLKLMSIELVMPSNHLILCCPLLLLPSIFPSSIRVFSNESLWLISLLFLIYYTAVSIYYNSIYSFMGFPGGSDGKASVYNEEDLGSSPELGRSPGEGNGNPLQYYCLENPLDRGAW